MKAKLGKNAYDKEKTWRTLTGDDATTDLIKTSPEYQYLMNVPAEDRFTEFYKMYITAFNVPKSTDTYWADQAKIIGGADHGQNMYDLVMSNALDQRSDVVLLLATMRAYRHIEFKKDSWFADVAYQIGCDVDCGLGQMFYEKIQKEPLENRAAAFISLANTVDENKNPFITLACEDVIRQTMKNNFKTKNGYYNPYYESGSGIFSFVGK